MIGTLIVIVVVVAVLGLVAGGSPPPAPGGARVAGRPHRRRRRPHRRRPRRRHLRSRPHRRRPRPRRRPSRPGAARAGRGAAHLPEPAGRRAWAVQRRGVRAARRGASTQADLGLAGGGAHPGRRRGRHDDGAARRAPGQGADQGDHRRRRPAPGSRCVHPRAPRRRGVARSCASTAGTGEPDVWLFVGVNGVGKTTTIGKLARRQSDAGRSVLLAAGDTFRAAAAEQLAMWAERTGTEIVRGAEGGDPSAIVFDAVQRAAARGNDLVLADTAGRLHTKVNLVEELEEDPAGRRPRPGQRDRGPARPRRHHGPERPGPGPAVRRRGGRDGDRAHQARRHRQGRDRDRRPARALRARSSWSASARGPTTWSTSTPTRSSTRSSPPTDRREQRGRDPTGLPDRSAEEGASRSCW